MFPTLIGLWVLGSIAILFIASAILKWLWNITIPDIFNLRAIRYWEAMRLIIICGILFGAPYMNYSTSM